MRIDCRCRSLVVAATAIVVAACGDPSAVASPRVASPVQNSGSHAVGGLVDCEVTIENGFVRAIGAGAPSRPVIECSPSPAGSGGPEGQDRGVFASDTILEGFNEIGFTYGTPTWTVVAGVGTMSVPITIVNHIPKPLGTSDGVTPAANGTRVFIMSGPTVLTCGGLCIGATVTVTNSTGTGTFTTANQMYFEYSGIIQPDSASAPVTWTFAILEANKFNFQVGVDAVVP
jgi:hypothetical protein